MRSIGFTVAVATLAASTALAAKPVLRVNGDEITDADLKIAEQAVAMQMPGGKPNPELVVRHAVDRLIGRTLVLQAAHEAKITVDPKEVTAALERQKAQAGGPEQFAKAIAEAGLTEAQLLQMETDQLVVQKYIETELVGKTHATDEEARAYYDQHPSEFTHPEQIKPRMILFMVKEGADQAEQDAAKARAEAALKRVKAGEDFAKVAGEVSEDKGSKPRGGEVGWIRKGMLLPELEEPVWGLKAGEVSPVLHAKFGYYVFKVDERRPGGTSGFDEVKESLAQFLRNRKVNDSVRLLIMGRRAKAKIEALDPSLKAAIEPLPQPGAAAPEPAEKPAGAKPGAAATPAPDAPKKP